MSCIESDEKDLINPLRNDIKQISAMKSAPQTSIKKKTQICMMPQVLEFKEESISTTHHSIVASSFNCFKSTSNIEK